MLVYYCFLCLFALQGYSQSKANVKFGDVSEKNFATKIYSIDSNANAVVIADIGSSEIEGNREAWFSLVFKRYKRIHILNKNGYGAANISIPLFTSGSAEENIDKLKAVTYNLENGKVVETKLDVKANVFVDKISKNLVVKKFTLPNVKEGSIIEVEYTITSDFLSNLQPWEFQGGEPVLWSEYNLSLPDFLGYVFLTQGYHAYDINERKVTNQSFRVIDSRGTTASEQYNFNSNVTDYHWVMKNVRALKEENFTSTLNNHIAKIEFQLSEYRHPLVYRNLMGTWQNMADKMLESEYFGYNLSRETGWLKDIVKPLIAGVSSNLEKAQKMYAYVRDNYTSTSNNVSLSQNLKNFAKGRSGNVAEINLLLTAMLKYADIEADPLILSTRSHGFTFPLYPLPAKFNYTTCRAIIDGKIYYLDASEPRMGFGFLPLHCYNGHARIISKNSEGIELAPDSVLEKKTTSVFIINDDKGNLIGSLQQTPGYFESYSLRNKIKEKGAEQLQKDIKKEFGADIVMSNFHLDSLEKYENELGLRFDFDIKDEKEDIIYLNPLFGEGQKENPFKSAERFYPVEMPCTFDETYNLQLETPHGYVVDELPKSMVVKLNEEGEGMFEYRVSQSGQNISLRSRIRISRAYFLPEEYEMLREFYNLIVTKQAQQIVFKKQK